VHPLRANQTFKRKVQINISSHKKVELYLEIVKLFYVMKYLFKHFFSSFLHRKMLGII